MVQFNRDPFTLFRPFPAFDTAFRAAEHLASQLANEVHSGRIPVPAGGAGQARLHATEDAFHGTVLVPGFGPDDLEFGVERSRLFLRGTPAEGSGATAFERTFRLPFQVDDAAAEATVENGVLTFKLPRSGADKPRLIRLSDAADSTAEAPESGS